MTLKHYQICVSFVSLVTVLRAYEKIMVKIYIDDQKLRKSNIKTLLHQSSVTFYTDLMLFL